MAHSSTMRDRKDLDATNADGPEVGLVDRVDRFRVALDDLRVREHLRRVETDLRAADTDHLSPTLRIRRRRQLDRLRDYWQRGWFPRNRAVPRRAPCFVGADGTDCAVGHMIRQDGRGDLADRIADADLTVSIDGLAADTGHDAAWPDELSTWLDRNGFTLAEAARIQPTYGEAVDFATTCGPISCRVAGVLSGLVATAVCAGFEYAGYRLAGQLFPENVLKRRVALAYFTVLTLLALPLLALVGYALFP